MQVTITGFEVGGKTMASNGPCLGTHFGDSCLQKIQNDEDSVQFEYVLNGTVVGGPPVSSTAFLCYSPWSQIGRPWRATSAAKDTLVCPFCSIYKTLSVHAYLIRLSPPLAADSAGHQAA